MITKAIWMQVDMLLNGFCNFLAKSIDPHVTLWFKVQLHVKEMKAMMTVNDARRKNKLPDVIA